MFAYMYKIKNLVAVAVKWLKYKNCRALFDYIVQNVLKNVIKLFSERSLQALAKWRKQ